MNGFRHFRVIKCKVDYDPPSQRGDWKRGTGKHGTIIQEVENARVRDH